MPKLTGSVKFHNWSKLSDALKDVSQYNFCKTKKGKLQFYMVREAMEERKIIGLYRLEFQNVDVGLIGGWLY